MPQAINQAGGVNKIAQPKVTSTKNPTQKAKTQESAAKQSSKNSTPSLPSKGQNINIVA